jgi:hypothetical protein
MPDELNFQVPRLGECAILSPLTLVGHTRLRRGATRPPATFARDPGER